MSTVLCRLHDTFVECPEYAGYVIPPAPPRPDFDASREKLRKLGDAEGNMTKEEFNKMKQVRHGVSGASKSTTRQIEGGFMRSISS